MNVALMGIICPMRLKGPPKSEVMYGYVSEFGRSLQIRDGFGVDGLEMAESQKLSAIFVGCNLPGTIVSLGNVLSCGAQGAVGVPGENKQNIILNCK